MNWNPWHGCIKYSEGCKHCYVYRRDEKIGRDPAVTSKTKSFTLPVQKNRPGTYKIPSGATLFTCMTSDFFIEKADAWREEAWAMIRRRDDVHFIIFTKRILRVASCLPDDWGDGYENVTIMCTMENQRAANERLPVFLSLPLRHRKISVEPMLEAVDLEEALRTGKIEEVVCGGESGPGARPMHYEWAVSLKEQCSRTGTGFYFHQTGLHFVKDKKAYTIPRKLQHVQAEKSGLSAPGARPAPKLRLERQLSLLSRLDQPEGEEDVGEREDREG